MSTLGTIFSSLASGISGFAEVVSARQRSSLFDAQIGLINAQTSAVNETANVRAATPVAAQVPTVPQVVSVRSDGDITAEGIQQLTATDQAIAAQLRNLQARAPTDTRLLSGAAHTDAAKLSILFAGGVLVLLVATNR